MPANILSLTLKEKFGTSIQPARRTFLAYYYRFEVVAAFVVIAIACVFVAVSTYTIVVAFDNRLSVLPVVIINTTQTASGQSPETWCSV